jgi:V/A-type H+-transporting ATPase subunit I
MKKVSLIVHHNFLEETIKKLHENGLMEIVDISKEEPEIIRETEKASMHSDADICANYELRLSRIIDILDKIRVKPKGIKSMLNPELPKIKTVEDLSLEEMFSHIEAVLEENEKNILDSDQKLQDLEEQKQSIKVDIEHINYLKDFDIDISDVGESEYVFIKTGKTSDLAPLKSEIDKIENSLIFSKQFGSGKQIEWSVVITAHILEKDKIEKICRERLIEFDVKHLSGFPKDILKSFDKQIKDKKLERKEIISHLRKYAESELHELRALKEEIQLEKIRKELPKNFAKTNSTYIINGWVAEKNEENLKSEIEKASKEHIIYRSKIPSINPDNPPTYLETPKWAAGFKGLLSMFATPKYNEIDPTIIMGFFFVLFFGVMLGDAGYGGVILILSLFAYIKLGKHSPMIKSMSFMGIWMGLITTIVGILTYSIFGDFVHRFIAPAITNNLDKPIYGFNLIGIRFPVEPLNDPLGILSVALILGIIHLNVGVSLGIYQSFKQKKYKELITERFCWILLQIGGGLLIGKFLMDWEIATPLFYAGSVMVIIGIILLLIASGPVGFFDITGYVGDWLSYARLLALGLATAGMALAFNVVSGMTMIDIPIVGLIIPAILLIILHLVNLGLQALGAAVHSLRLQYVEFFNRFYEGGGHEFTPFKMKRKYTKLEEEKID